MGGDHLVGVDRQERGLEDVLVIPMAQQNENTRPRVGRVLHALGWQRRQRRRPDGTREWFYARAVASVTSVTGASPPPNGEDPEVDPALPRQIIKPTGDTGDTGDKPGKQAPNAVTSYTAAPVGTGDAGDGADAQEVAERTVFDEFNI
jgi:hypothetical protein